jgi:hypothetical protein
VYFGRLLVHLDVERTVRSIRIDAKQEQSDRNKLAGGEKHLPTEKLGKVDNQKDKLNTFQTFGSTGADLDGTVRVLERVESKVFQRKCL